MSYLHDALQWALAEIEGRTHYKDASQRENALKAAKEAYAQSEGKLADKRFPDIAISFAMPSERRLAVRFLGEEGQIADLNLRVQQDGQVYGYYRGRVMVSGAYALKPLEPVTLEDIQAAAAAKAGA